MENKNFNQATKFLAILIICLAIVTSALIFTIQEPEPQAPVQYPDELKKFSSIEELKNFLKANSESSGYYATESMMVKTTSVAPGVARAQSVSDSASEFSSTNIQVQGVDEPDILKNDGKYIYTITGNKVVITEAFPASGMKILSEIDFNQTNLNGIFINNDKLIVFSDSYNYIPYEPMEAGVAYKVRADIMCFRGGCGGYSESKTNVYIYDISDKESPILEKNITLDGSYNDARMIDDYVYVISTKYVYADNPQPPVYIMDGIKSSVPITDIYYFDYPDSSYVFTSISAVNINSQEFNTKVYLTGNTGTLYVSKENIYLTHQKTFNYKDYQNKLIEDVFLEVLPENEQEKVQEILDSDNNFYDKYNDIQQIVYNYSNSLEGEEKDNFDSALQEKMQNFQIKMQKETDKTVVYKINIDKDEITYKTSGDVPGHLLNQFSMDEHEGNLRLATTTGDSWGGNSLNHLYVLNEELEILGKVEDLAKGEKIYSARFLGDRAYMVTFKKIDPLFVIDLSTPEAPEVLGYLKITGYSDYLHPYDENHIIGIGKEAKGGGENFAWYQGMKISLFDVSDVSAPVEQAKFEIGDRGTDSPVLHDHKAFLFDKKRNLLVIPVTVNEIQDNQKQWPGQDTDSIYGEPVWQGAYVLNIDENSISLKGKITHFDSSEQTQDKWNFYDSKYQIQRSLFMDDVLYTFSNSMLKANDLSTIDELNSIELPYTQNYYPVYGRGMMAI